MADIEHKHLRSALEFAVLMASEGRKRKPALPYPKELKPFFNKARLPSAALGRLRRVVDGDPVFRTRLSAGALPELVDDIGRLWLEHRDGWEQRANELAAQIDADAESGDSQAQLRRAEKQRDAAEQAAARTRVELLHRAEVVEMQATEIDELRAEVAKAAEVVQEMNTELTDVRMEIRHARDREAAAAAKATTAETQVRELQRQPTREQLEQVEPMSAGADNSIEIAAASATARLLLDQLDALLPERAAGTGQQGGMGYGTPRTALVLPGGVIASSAEAAEFLARSDAQFIIDGYNVAKLGWPNRPLAQQRDVFLDAVENLVRRFGTDITVVFDGASIVGAHTSRRRQVRVVYSPEGTIADDVIRDEVQRIPASHPVVIVTNDAEIVRDVRADGANVVPSNALLALI
jgi:predicted RNA-binding protein with PIN domain/Sec-independent protein translocase protein TatA